MSDEDFLTWWRVWSGASVDDLSDDVFYVVLSTVRDMYPESTDCNLKYWVACNCYKQLIRQYYANNATTGVEIGRKETRGKTTIAVDYSDPYSSSDGECSWETLLDALVANPQSLGCRPFEDTSSDINLAMVNGSGKSPWEYAAPYRKTVFNKLHRCRKLPHP